jgi:hypothetical protein
VSSEISHTLFLRSLFLRCRGLSNVLGAAPSWPAWTPASLLKVATSARGLRFQQVTFQSKLLRQLSHSETSPPQGGGEVAGGGAIAHPAVILMSRGFDPASHPAKSLVNYQSNRQLSGWNLPPLVKRAIGAHCESHKFRTTCRPLIRRRFSDAEVWCGTSVVIHRPGGPLTLRSATPRLCYA